MNQKPIALAGPSASQLPSSAPPSPALSLSPVSQEITALITDLQARRQATIQRALQHLLHNAPAGNGNGITHTSAHLLLKELKALTCHASNSVADLKSKLDALVERLLIQAVTASANCKEDRPAAPSPAHRDTAFDVLDGPTALPPSLRDFLFDVQAGLRQKVRSGLCQCVETALAGRDYNTHLNSLLQQIDEELALVGRYLAALANRPQS